MKRHLVLFMAVCMGYGLSSCASRPTSFPLNSGDYILLKGEDAEARALQVRTITGNDLTNTGNMVKITQPTSVVGAQ
jgi:hypothetical protein